MKTEIDVALEKRVVKVRSELDKLRNLIKIALLEKVGSSTIKETLVQEERGVRKAYYKAINLAKEAARNEGRRFYATKLDNEFHLPFSFWGCRLDEERRRSSEARKTDLRSIDTCLKAVLKAMLDTKMVGLQNSCDKYVKSPIEFVEFTDEEYASYLNCLQRGIEEFYEDLNTQFGKCKQKPNVPSAAMQSIPIPIAADET